MKNIKNPSNIQKLNCTLAELKKGKLNRRYLICGEEQYLVKRLSDHIVTAIKKQTKINDVEVLFGNYQSLIESDNRGIDSILESLSNIGTLFDTGEKIVWIKMCDHLINPKSVDDEAWKNDEKLSKKAKKIREFPDRIANIIEKARLNNNYFVFTAYTKPARSSNLVA